MSFQNIQCTVKRVFGVLPSFIEPNPPVHGILVTLESAGSRLKAGYGMSDTMLRKNSRSFQRPTCPRIKVSHQRCSEYLLHQCSSFNPPLVYIVQSHSSLHPRHSFLPGSSLRNMVSRSLQSSSSALLTKTVALQEAHHTFLLHTQAW